MYRVNEIFYSLQGEGRFAGTPAIFIRFSGCNLKCPFCDTNFKEGKKMSASEILLTAQSLAKNVLIVLTGGEPCLQLDEELLKILHTKYHTIAIETNGTLPVPQGLDWITVSPKTEFCGKETFIEKANEVKVVFDGKNNPKQWEKIKANYYYIQPCDTGNKEQNEQIISDCVDWLLKNPKWKLSLQTQKIINVR